MDIYRFLDSNDIRAHLQSLRYGFTLPEAAFLVWQCATAALSEKHTAWRELTQTMPDCKMERRRNMCEIQSMHGFLQEYIELEEKLLRTFCENDGGIYRWTECQEDGVRFEHPGIYTDYAKCRNRISREISDNEDGQIASYLVTKTYPDAEGDKSCRKSLRH